MLRSGALFDWIPSFFEVIFKTLKRKIFKMTRLIVPFKYLYIVNLRHFLFRKQQETAIQLFDGETTHLKHAYLTVWFILRSSNRKVVVYFVNNC